MINNKTRNDKPFQEPLARVYVVNIYLYKEKEKKNKKCQFNQPINVQTLSLKATVKKFSTAISIYQHLGDVI